METTIFTPHVKPCTNGLYKVNCYIEVDNKRVGQIVMAEIVSDIEVRLISNVKHDKTWNPSSYKDRWFEKNDFIDQVTFYPPIN